jgi:hypothetical protein
MDRWFVARVGLEQRMTAAGARSACGRGQRPTGGAAPASRIPDPSVHKLGRGRRAVLAVSVQYYKRPSQPSPGSWGLQRLGPPGAAPDAGNPHTDLFCHSFQVRRWSRSPTICCLRRDEQEERRDAGEAGTAKLMAHGSPGNRPARRRSGAGSDPGRTSRPPLNLHGVTLTAQSPRMWPAVLAIRLRRIGPADSLALRV